MMKKDLVAELQHQAFFNSPSFYPWQNFRIAHLPKVMITKANRTNNNNKNDG